MSRVAPKSVLQRQITVALGASAQVVGQLDHLKSGPRESTSFAYDRAWLQSADRFAVSPDLPLVEGRQFRKAASRDDPVFHFALADTAPDGWGRRVIARDHAKRRRERAASGEPIAAVALTELDYLLGVDDISRIGALRLCDDQCRFLRVAQDTGRGVPPLLELEHLLGASRAVETGTDTEADLRYLRGRGTSLGGMRPKCTVVDDTGWLAIGKFPSVADDRSVTRGEVLALHLAAAAGIDTAASRIVLCEEMPVALIRRFDRTSTGARVPYLSAASMLQASRHEDHAYTEIADAIVATCADPARDLAQLWRRIVFNLLITNVDDHLQNHGFLYAGRGQWRLAPAFDLNPFPDKDRELKTWLTEATGPTDSVVEVVEAAGYFRLTRLAALEILAEVHRAVRGWKGLARSAAVGMTERDLRDVEPAFEHEQVGLVERLLAG
ncbi:MAG: hypothetical protein RJB37_3537 [Pseudomonadota bacterium]